MKNNLFFIVILVVSSSCSIYNYKTVDVTTETFKSVSDFLDKRNFDSRKLEDSKFYFYDELGRLFSVEQGSVEDSSFKLLNVKKNPFHSSRYDHQLELKEDETHIFTSKKLKQTNYGSNPMRFTISIKPNEIDSIRKYPPKQVPINEFILKKRTVKDIFDQNGFSKNINNWKFYISDLDGSTFECTNLVIHDSTLSTNLIPNKKSKILQLDKSNRMRKNEVYLKINSHSTNKKSKVYIKPGDILSVNSYMSQKDLDFKIRSISGKIWKTFGIIVLLALVAFGVFLLYWSTISW